MSIRFVLCLPLWAAVCFTSGLVRAAEEAPSDEQLKLVIQFVGDADRETRAVGLQYVREQLPGEAATRAFAALVPQLKPDGQAELIAALGDRGDAAARPAVVDALKSQEEPVRAAALRALGSLGSAEDVGLLADKAAAGTPLEKTAAKQSLARLRGDKVNGAILAALGSSQPKVRAVLLGALGARNAKEALPSVLKCVEDPERPVRLAALDALRLLAGQQETAAIVKILKSAPDDAQRARAEAVLLAVCSRHRQECAGAIIEGMAGADAASRVALLHAVARAGGPKALETVVARIADDDQTVRDEAVRTLALWSDRAAAPHLAAIAGKGENPRYQVLAVRGLVRLASPQEGRPADLAMLAEAMKLAGRPEEKGQALAVLGDVGTRQALDLIAPALDDAAVAEEAAVAAVSAAEKLQKDKEAGDAVRSALEKVLQKTKNEAVRDRARNVLNSR